MMDRERDGQFDAADGISAAAKERRVRHVPLAALPQSYINLGAKGK